MLSLRIAILNIALIFVADVAAEAQQQHPVRLRAKSTDSRIKRGSCHHVGQGQERGDGGRTGGKVERAT